MCNGCYLKGFRKRKSGLKCGLCGKNIISAKDCRFYNSLRFFVINKKTLVQFFRRFFFRLSFFFCVNNCDFSFHNLGLCDILVIGDISLLRFFTFYQCSTKAAAICNIRLQTKFRIFLHVLRHNIYNEQKCSKNDIIREVAR